MLKQIYKVILVLTMTSSTSSFAQNGDGIEGIERMRQIRHKDQFVSFVMKGFNIGMEYSSMSAKGQVKYENAESDFAYRTDAGAPAGALGVSLNYADLRRSSTGWSTGVGIITKIDNETSDKNSLKSGKRITQIRPEGNLAYAFSNGVWGMVGGHFSHFMGESSTVDSVAPIGVGIQLSVGFTPVRNFGMDIGYYATHHALGDKTVSALSTSQSSVNRTESYFIFQQLRARGTYYF